MTDTYLAGLFFVELNSTIVELNFEKLLSLKIVELNSTIFLEKI